MANSVNLGRASKYKNNGRTNSMASVQRKTGKAPPSKAQKILFWRRIMTVIAGSSFVPQATQTTVNMFQSVNGVKNLVHTYTLDDSSAMRQWVGTTTIYQSPLVQTALGGHTDLLD